MLGVVYFI